MRWDFGKVYKEIRKSKGLSQQEVCGDRLSRTSLLKIENCQSIPNFEHMVYLLNQIDMSLDEFIYICNLYQPSERQSLIIEVNNLLGTPDISKIQELVQRCNNCLAKEDDVPIKNLRNVLEMFQWIRTNGIQKKNPEYQKLVLKIWEPLERRDSWYISDFRLLNAILHHFPIDCLQKITQHIFRNLEKYKDYCNIKRDQITLLVNLSTVFIKYGHLRECEEILVKLLKLCKEMKSYDDFGLCQIRLGICRGDSSLIEKGRQLLILCEEKDLLQAVDLEIERYGSEVILND